MDLVARQSLCALPGGAAAGGQLAEAFEGVAQRMDLYGSYNEIQSEISRRLDSLVPADPAMRSLWNERLFQPLSARIADVMRREGLDLAAAGASDATLTEPQKNQLRGTFTAIVQGFKSASGSGKRTSRSEKLLVHAKAPTRLTVQGARGRGINAQTRARRRHFEVEVNRL